MFDTIVFSQKELISAIQNGYRRIGICDNIFVIPEGYFVNGYGIKLI